MQCEIGKVVKYDGFTGKIVTQKDTYMFLDSDVEGTVELNDYVRFRNEEIQGSKRAFFVKQVPLEKVRIMELKKED